MSGVSYHQSTFDLLDIQPLGCPKALAMIEECERKRGSRLPESVRQWYATENVVVLTDETTTSGGERYPFVVRLQ